MFLLNPWPCHTGTYQSHAASFMSSASKCRMCSLLNLPKPCSQFFVLSLWLCNVFSLKLTKAMQPVFCPQLLIVWCVLSSAGVQSQHFYPINFQKKIFCWNICFNNIIISTTSCHYFQSLKMKNLNCTIDWI